MFEKACNVLFLAPVQESAAQRCNEDVLLTVFFLIDTKTLALCAPVCQGWLDPARRCLYANLTFDADKMAAPALAAALRKNAVLRSYIRHLTLLPHRRDGVPFLFDWLTQLPASGIGRIDVSIFTPEPEFMSAFAQCPALRGVNHLSLRRSFLSFSAKLEHFASLPTLKSLFISLPMGYEIPENVSAGPLKRLSITSYAYDHQISRFLSVCAPSLVRLDLHVVEWPTSLESLSDALSSLSHLRDLSVHGRFLPSSPFLDDVVLRLMELESLYCTHGTWSSFLLRNLPPSLRVLKLHKSHRSPFPVEDAVSAISQWPMALKNMRCLILVDHDHPETLRQLGNVCDCVDVEFKWEAWDQRVKLLD